MTRKLLESYQSNKRLMERNNKKIEEENSKDIPSVCGKVKGSSKEFPYIERRFSVEMHEPEQADKQRERIDKWEEENEQADKQMKEVERFIENIEDAKYREIFSYRYLDGMKVKEVAEKVGYSHGRVSQIISKILKD